MSLTSYVGLGSYPTKILSNKATAIPYFLGHKIIHVSVVLLESSKCSNIL